MSIEGSDPFALMPYRAIVDAPKIKWPNQARVAVWVIPNVEHHHLEVGSPSPDVRNHSRKEYGNRVGIWRLMEVLDKFDIRGTVALNAEIARYYPRIMEAMIARNWELMGHGLTNSRLLSGLEIDAERAVIHATKKIIAEWGRTMKGWLSPGLTETFNTPQLLRDAGVEYVADWVNDDLPYCFNNGLYSIPYSIEVNDMPLFITPSISIDDFCRRIIESFDVLYAEGETTPRVFGIALHPFLIGVPHRIRYLERALAHIAGHDKVWFATGEEIIATYRAQDRAASH
jgi:peptidoglycan/xylan/chitin deacetylase (PgdA/CDA1 family)